MLTQACSSSQHPAEFLHNSFGLLVLACVLSDYDGTNIYRRQSLVACSSSYQVLASTCGPCLRWGDTQLVLQLAHSRMLAAHDLQVDHTRPIIHLVWFKACQLMAAAGVCPDEGEGDLHDISDIGSSTVILLYMRFVRGLLGARPASRDSTGGSLHGQEKEQRGPYF